MRNVDTEEQRDARRVELDREDKLLELKNEAAEAEAKRSNKGFTQVYGKGWARIRDLINTNPTSAKIYTFLAEHISGTEGAVVVSQNVMATTLDLHVITIKRHTKLLEKQGALVRIRVGGNVYAYALDPDEIWKSWNEKKALAAFTTRTLVLKKDVENSTVDRKLRVMIGEN